MEYRDFFGDRHRETFMKALCFSMGWFLFGVITWVQAENLIPSTVNKAPDYYCTWASQNYMEGWGVTNFDCSTIEGGNGNSLAQTWIRDTTVFGPRGWSTLFHPKARPDLYLMFDDGEFADWSDNSFILDAMKFPSFKGLTPAQQWTRANDSLKAKGWRALALWCRGPDGANSQPITWCKTAGIPYWKIDGGDGDFAQESMRKTLNASIVMEHMPDYSYPLNGNWAVDGRYGALTWGTGGTVGTLCRADVVRSYDVTPALSVATTLDRVNEILKVCGGHTEAVALLNDEDEVYIAAALGLTMGVMRHPMSGKRFPIDCDLFFNGSRQVKKRMDEVTRAARWHRIGEPFPAGIYPMTLDAAVLTDSWTFSTGDTWLSDVIGKTAFQGAAARSARGLNLPVVRTHSTNKDSIPFVIAGRYPNGAVSIATLGRTKPNNNWYFPKAAVSITVPDSTKQFGIFGYYDSLSFVFSSAVASGIKVLAQDLAGDSAVNITSMVKISTNTLTIPGAIIAQIGLSAKTTGDVSDPGMLMVLRSGTSTLIPASHSIAKPTPATFKIFDSVFRIPPEFSGKSVHIEICDLCGRTMNSIFIEGKNQLVNICKHSNSRLKVTGGLHIVHISIAE
jgi:hypothetical protein